MICEQCGGSRVVSYPPPACGCPGCGAPVCCQTCCDARSTGYAPEGNRAESTSSAAIPKMQAFAPMEEMARLRADLLAPGVMRCAKCNFGLQRVILNVNNGTSTSGDSKTEECPNGCGPLWPVTWKELSAEHLETAERFFDESAAAKKENDKLRAANARLQAWHDAVMGQETIGFEIVFKTGRWLKYDYKGYSPETKSELIIRPQPLAKE